MTEMRPSDLVDDTFPDSTAPPSARPSLEDLTEAMRDVVDPELMVNVVDLGLVYGIHLDDDNDGFSDYPADPECQSDYDNDESIL